MRSLLPPAMVTSSGWSPSSIVLRADAGIQGFLAAFASAAVAVDVNFPYDDLHRDSARWFFSSSTS